MQNQNLPAGQSVVVTDNPVDPNGNPGSYAPGSFVWGSPAPATGLTVTPSADGLTATVRAEATAPPGVTVIQVADQNSNGSAIAPVPAFSITVPMQPQVASVFTFGTPFANP